MAQEIYPGISVDVEVVHGKPVISGTRVPVSLVLGQLAGGISYDELEREYSLAAEQVHAALGYATGSTQSESSTARRAATKRFMRGR